MKIETKEKIEALSKEREELLTLERRGLLNEKGDKRLDQVYFEIAMLEKEGKLPPNFPL